MHTQADIFVYDADPARRRRLASAVADTARRVKPVTDLSALAAATSVDRAAIIVGFAAAQAAEVFARVAQLRRANRRIPIIVVGTERSEEIAVTALRSGVNDYFREPVDYAAVAASVARCLPASGERAPAAEIKAEIKLIGSSATLRHIEDYLAKVARHDVTVLITGETGTGKELAAARIHSLSPRRHAGSCR
jgi:DNA-binding NtrC family response regulator